MEQNEQPLPRRARRRKSTSTVLQAEDRHQELARRYLGPMEIAHYAGVSRSRVFLWLREGRETRGQRGLWPQYRPSASTVLVRVEDVDRLMEKFRTP